MFFLQSCAYAIYDDKRLLDTMTQDEALAKSIKAELMKKDFLGSFSISVYSFYKHVFLVGQIPANLQSKALRIAQSKNPISVTTHWFTFRKAQDSDFLLKSKLRAVLISTKGLSSTRVETEINAGRVVLLGVVESEAERKLAARAARRVEGIIDVTNFLMLPLNAKTLQKEPQLEEPSPMEMPEQEARTPVKNEPATTFEEREL